MKKSKKRFERLKNASMCRMVQPYVEIDKEGELKVFLKHLCGESCEYLKARNQ